MATTLKICCLILISYIGVSSSSNGKVISGSSREEQLKLVIKASEDCYFKMNITQKPTDGVYCDMMFDNVMCWDYTPAGVLAKQSCPDYISGFHTGGEVLKQCLDTGEWYVHPRFNTSWTKFDDCSTTIVHRHLPKITLLARVGYSISLVSLLLAVFIMVYFQKLHCQRNTIHINLFVSCLVRAGICLLKEFIFVHGIGLTIDIEYDETGKPSFKKDSTHWQCKLLFTMFHYVVCANYMWVFVEGLYLHNLIFFTVFNIRKLYLVLYILIGWLSPLLMVIPWVIVRIYKEDTDCWNTHYTSYYWIIRGPIIASICVNFLFFLNIIRVLFTKLMTSITRESNRYQKLAKSTLVLIPLFGVQYILFVVLTYQMEAIVEVVKLYAEMFLNSFQGAIVAVLFCFLNGEVRGEIKKIWNRYMLRRESTSSRHTSRNFNTSTSFVGRDRRVSDGNQQSVGMVQLDMASKTPIYNGNVKHVNKKLTKSENGDLKNTNSMSENTSLINMEAQREITPTDIQGKELSVNSECSSLLPGVDCAGNT